MVSNVSEYTRDVGKERYANSAAKTLIYQTGADIPGKVKQYKHKARGEVPFATFDGSEHDKYPQHFSLRRKGADGADKVGGAGFDPELYRQQVVSYNKSKVCAPRKAYIGAGDILHHPGASRPESQQVAISRMNSSHGLAQSHEVVEALTDLDCMTQVEPCAGAGDR